MYWLFHDVISVLSVVCIASAVYASTFKENKEEITALSEADATDESDEIEVEETESVESEPEKEYKEESAETAAKVPESSNISANENKEQSVAKAENKPKKGQPVNDQPATQKTNTEKKTPSKAAAYRSNKLGIQLTFPSNWQNKYTVTETKAGIVISYIFQHDYYYDYYGQKYSRGDCKTRYLVSIQDVSLLSENDLAVIDKINNVPRFKMIHGKKYVIGGPTDCLESGDPDRAEVDQFLRDLPNIINNIKEI